ncbi:MAG: cytochrome c-type biogenesis protein, partial [Rhodobiaceae bacterium]
MTGCLSRILKTGLALVMLAMVTGPLPAPAVTPEEMLADPALESRARALSKQLRCLVCQNQSIDDSDAELARDLRVEVRKQLATGASDAEILATLRETYGDYVLLNPPVSPGTYILWGAPVVILLGGLAIMLAGRRRREGDAAMIADDEAAPASPAASLDRRVALALASLVMAASLGLYLVLGRADLPARPLAERGAEIAAAATQAQQAASDRGAALQQARAAATETPDDVGAWLRLAMAAAASTDSATEIMALEQAERLTGGDPAIRAMRAEAMARAADGQVTIPARELIAGILAVNPA